MEDVDHKAALAMPTAQLQRTKNVVTNDPVMAKQTKRHNTKRMATQNLEESIMTSEMGWLSKKVLGSQLVIPSTMRREMMSLTHAGMEGCIRKPGGKCIGLECHLSYLELHATS